MDVFNEYILDFWRACQTARLRYIIVGGFAINLHGYQRVTDDMDILIEDNLENRKSLREAFKIADIGDFEPLERLEFIPGWTYFHLNNGFRLDVMTNVKGLEMLSFQDLYKNAVEVQIKDIKVRFLNINHLIASKKAANRPEDQIDVIYLEKIKKLQEEEKL
jgi:predicted nucleotidyltransferase